MPTDEQQSPLMYTVGHSNHDEETFLDLLRLHGIEVLVDVRSQPASRYNTHFNAGPLKVLVESAGMQYLFMGDQLGGRPARQDFFDEEGRALYHKMAESAEFLQGIQRLENGIRDYRVVIMCSEENPAVCHRHLLVTRVMWERGVDVQHIRGDGRLMPDEEIGPRESQAALFDDLEQDSWKSLRSVLPKPPPPSSSEN